MGNNRIKIIYITGCGRSGSTLLGEILGQIDGFFFAGELSFAIWQRGFIENQLCGCGVPFRNCDIWNAVVQKTFGGLDNVNMETIKMITNILKSNIRIPRMILPLNKFEYRKHYQIYTQNLGGIFRVISEVTGCKTIVDSSKHPLLCYILNSNPGIDLHVFHLIRDSRAVAFSWQRKKVRPEIHWEQRFMKVYTPEIIARRWNIRTLFSNALKLRVRHFITIRYEDLVKYPKYTLSKALKNSKKKKINMDFIHEDIIDIGINHTVSGNPIRFAHGTIKIRPDLEWQTKMHTRHKAMVTVLTYPFLRMYGYK